jgi:UDP:flavonoid glycosyltransferase YjiC (YdhE family)
MCALFLSCCIPPKQPFFHLIERLQQRNATVSVLATGYSAQVLSSHGLQYEEINPNNIDLSTPSEERASLIQTIVSTYKRATLIFTDTNHPFFEEVVRELKIKKGISHGFFNFAQPFNAVIQA